ncbi:hypothetical protein [Bradyrhizobium sp. SRS-191]|uniref:hypothetical protein n=1 Tax=Bradyrhizobium sp. SRS-191 TaxID=2962606 RepID=UPI00211EA78D|nr:hypothetical protein [Bradyrhizobium sp. SRS-191]
MMSKVEMSRLNLKASGAPVSAVPPTEPTDEDRSKDEFFAQVGLLAEAMIARHGKEFAIGTLVLAAKFVAEGRSLVSRGAEAGGAVSAAKPV